MNMVLVLSSKVGVLVVSGLVVHSCTASSSMRYEDIPWLYAASGSVTQRRYYIRPTLPRSTLKKDIISTEEVDSRRTVDVSHLSRTLPYKEQASWKSVAVYAVDESSCEEYTASIIKNETTGNYEFTDIKGTAPPPPPGDDDEKKRMEDSWGLVRYELNGIAEDHEFYELDSSITNSPSPSTTYRATHAQLTITLTKLGGHHPLLQVNGDHADRYNRLHVYPIGRSLYSQLDRDDMNTAKRFIMEPYAGGLPSAGPLPQDNLGTVGYGISNLNAWDNSYATKVAPHIRRGSLKGVRAHRRSQS
ncbi:hypothetical protein FOZ63_004821 [Perkinsus olseni]|uniref:Uncharacterized protein n=2 Tax=Perkinsus olseni TaxID=32597 RepID=A0A7J6R224_PEROL|nr:hypothetical protein FOZ63_004821 [Perkinsus olseni]